VSGPFIFIATNSLKEGKLEAERDRAAELGSFIEAHEPQLLAFNEYANEEGTEVGVVQVHPDAASMEFHMEVVAEQARLARTQRRSRRQQGSRSTASRAKPCWRYSDAKPELAFR
jgi:hypothetical protein